MQQTLKKNTFHVFLFLKKKERNEKYIFLWFVFNCMYSFFVMNFFIFFQSPHTLCIYSDLHMLSHLQYRYNYILSLTNKSPFFSLRSVSPGYCSSIIVFFEPLLDSNWMILQNFSSCTFLKFFFVCFFKFFFSIFFSFFHFLVVVYCSRSEMIMKAYDH